MTLVRAKGIVVRRRGEGAHERVVLDGVDCEVREGEVAMLIGPNGAGKSTLLSALAGDLRPAAGSIELAGRPLAGWPAPALALRRAVLPQRAALNLPFTVEEVVRLGCHARPERGTVVAGIVAAAMSAAGVTPLATRSVARLSGGERARAHLARILAQVWPAPADPAPGARLLLLDEPCASLDAHFQHAICAMLRDVARRTGMGILAAMHDLNLAVQYADRVVVLREGRVAATGTPAEALTAATVNHCFGVDLEYWQAGGTALAATRPPVEAR